MVVCNAEPDIRFRRRVLGMVCATLLIAAVLSLVVYFAIGNERDVDVFATLWMMAGLPAVVIMFSGMACILHDRFRRMRRDRDYWIYLCNEYRTGRSPRLERVWRGLGTLDDIVAMDAVEAELPDCWKKGRSEMPRAKQAQ